MMTDRSHPLVPRLRFPEFAQDSAWEYATVAALVDTVTPPKKLSSSKYLQEGRFPIIDQSQNYICGWTDDDEAIITKPLPVIVFGDHTCVLKLVDQPFAQGADGIKIITVNRSVSVEYLYYHMLHRPLVTKQYKRHFSTLKNRFVCFPNPKSGEQQKIADCLGSLDDLIAAETQKLKALRQQKQGLMQQLFPKPGETVLRLRFPEFWNTAKWVRIPLSDAFKTIVNGRANAQDHEEDGVYPLFDRSKVVKRSRTFLFDTEAVILPGEGMSFQPQYFNGKFNLHQRVYALMEPTLDSHFAFYALDRYKAALADSAVQSTVRSLRMSIIENFDIPCPTSGPEQQKIADCLGSMDDMIAAEGRKLKALQQHKQGLMQQLFPCLETK